MLRKLAGRWRKEKLGNLCDICRGSSPRPIADQRYFVDGTIPWIKIADATKSGKYLYETKEHVNEYGASFSRLLPKGSLIIAASGTLGYPQFLGVDGCAHDGWLIPSKFRGIDPDFLYYLFLVKKEFFYSSAYGAAIQNINTIILREMDIEIPDLPTQQKIASILSVYDDLIENNTRRINILEKMAQAIYRHWFVDFKFPGHKKVKFIDSKLGKIPEGWEVIELGNKITFKKGKNITKNKIIYGNVPVVAAGVNPAYYHNESNAKSPVVTISASGANAGFIRLYYEDIWASDCSYINNDSTKAIFYYYSLLMNKQVEISALQRGSAQPHVYPKDIMKSLIVSAPEKVVTQFEEISKTIFYQLKYLKLKNQNLRRTRDLLLPKLISGEIDVSGLEIES